MQSDFPVIICPQCGQTNNHFRRSCWNCDLPFVSIRKLSFKRILIIMLLDILLLSIPILFIIYASSDAGGKAIGNYFTNRLIEADRNIKANHKR